MVATLLYTCESWTLTKDEKRLAAFEMKAYRRLLRVSWKDRKTNEWVMGEVTIQRSHQGKEVRVHWSRGSMSRAGETSDGRRYGGKTKERKTYDYLDDEFEGMEWRECNRTHEAGARQGGVEKKCQMGAPTAASAKELINDTSCSSA